MKVVVVGAGVGGLATAARLAASGHAVTLLEATSALGGKCGRVELAGHVFDSGPSLLTMPRVLCDLLDDVGAPPLELLPVAPVTRYRFADGSCVDVGVDGPQTVAALEAWSPGAGADWAALQAVREDMWRAAAPFLSGPPPWPPRRPAPGSPPPDPRDGLRVRPWSTLSGLAAQVIRDRRLRMVVERFATYAGSDPRRAPAALLLAGHVEHAFGAWHPRGGLSRIVEALADRLRELGAEILTDVPVTALRREGRRVTAAETAEGRRFAAEAVVFDGDEAALGGLLGRRPGRRRERSHSGLAVMLALRGRTPGAAHHEITFPADYAREFDDLFHRRVAASDPAIYVSRPSVTDGSIARDDQEGAFVLVNAPAGVELDAEREADRVVASLGLADRVIARAVRTPADLQAQTGALGGAIYGAATHGRLASLRRPDVGVAGVRGLLRVGGTVHPGGGLPLVMLGAARVAREIGPA